MFSLALAFVLSAQSPLEPPDFLLGAYLVHACEGAFRVLDPATTQFKDADVALGEHCLGYLQGFMDGGRMKSWSICLPQMSLSDTARIYVVYMKRNPQLLAKPKAMGILFSLKERFPCSVENEQNRK